MLKKMLKAGDYVRLLGDKEIYGTIAGSRLAPDGIQEYLLIPDLEACETSVREFYVGPGSVEVCNRGDV